MEETTRVSVYLDPRTKEVVSRLARERNLSHTAVFRQALGGLQAIHDATADGCYVGTVRDRERLDTLIVAPF